MTLLCALNDDPTTPLSKRERTSGGLTCDLYVDLILPDASAAAAAAPAAAVVAGHALPRARSDATGLCYGGRVE